MRSSSIKAGCCAVATVAMLTVLLAGCGGVSRSPVLAAVYRGDRVPVAGSRALAMASARRLLGLLVLPAGSHELHVWPGPRELDQPGVSVLGPGNFLDLHRLYRLPMRVSEAIAFLHAHVPRGTVSNSSTGGGSADGVTSTAVLVTQQRLPAGIEQIHLVDTLVPGKGSSSVLRADAQVVWYPPRSSAEYLVAARFRSVRITATGGYGAGSISGGQRMIVPLVAVLDSMHATTTLVHTCPSPIGSYQLAFAPGVRGQLPVTIQGGDCNGDPVSVGGHPQPMLFDTGTLTALVRKDARA
jgi:hypothetical protein